MLKSQQSYYAVKALNVCIYIYIYEPFGLGRFATDRCYAPQVNGRYAALLLTNFILMVWYFGIDC